MSLVAYITERYLNLLYKKRGDLAVNPAANANEQVFYLDLDSLIHDHLKVKLDMEHAAIVARFKDDDPYFRRLIKRGTGVPTGLGSRFSSILKTEVLDQPTRQLCLIEEEIIAEGNTPDELGLIYSRFDNSEERMGAVLSDWPRSIDHKEPSQGWSILKDVNIPINSAIISDNFILTTNWEQNLYPLLSSLLPSTFSQDHPFDLTIVFRDYNTDSDLEGTVLEHYDAIEDWITTSYPYQVNFTLVKLPPRDFDWWKDLQRRGIRKESLKIHDRCILTNNYYLESGAGFNLFRSTRESGLASTHSTIIRANPIFKLSRTDGSIQRELSNLSIYNGLVKYIREALVEAKKGDGVEFGVQGSRENRILDL